MAPKDGADKATATDETTPEAGADEVLVRINPDLWQRDFHEIGDYRIGHEPVAVPKKLFDRELANFTEQRVNNDGALEDVHVVVKA